MQSASNQCGFPGVSVNRAGRPFGNGSTPHLAIVSVTNIEVGKGRRSMTITDARVQCTKANLKQGDLIGSGYASTEASTA